MSTRLQDSADVIAQFSITYTQILDANGQLLSPLPSFFENNPDQLQALYRMMVLIRTFDIKAVALQRTSRLGTYPPILGQEAVSIGLGAVLRPEDVLALDYRECGVQIQHGVTLSEILTFWGGDERGNCYASGNDDFPTAVPIASQCLHAVGAAAAFQYRQQKRVAISICGDGATSQGDFYEALNVAGVWNLPVVFLVVNNQWAISVPRSQQTHAKTLAQKAIAAGFKGEQVDGNDVIAVYTVLEEAIEKARLGDGPTLVEAITYRLHDHTTADDAARYRPREELEIAQKNEPIRRLRHYLMQQKLWSDEEETALQKDCAIQVEAAVNTYLSQTPEPVTAMFDYHYAVLPDNLVEQREDAERYAQGHQHE